MDPSQINLEAIPPLICSMSSYMDGYYHGMFNAVTITFGICCAIGLVWWLRFLTQRAEAR